MGYKIGRCELNSSGNFVETFYNHAIVQFNHIGPLIEFVPQIVLKTKWFLKLGPGNQIGVEPTIETENLLKEREIIISFWQDCLFQKINSSLEYKVEFHIINDVGEDVFLFEDGQEPPWRKEIIIPAFSILPNVRKK